MRYQLKGINLYYIIVALLKFFWKWRVNVLHTNFVTSLLLKQHIKCYQAGGLEMKPYVNDRGMKTKCSSVL